MTDDRAAMAAERKAFGREVVERVMGQFVQAAEERAERLRGEGRWDVFQQARLDGLRALAPEVEDFDLRFMSDLAHAHDLGIEFALVDRVEGVRFTDTGVRRPGDDQGEAGPDGALQDL